MKFKRTKPSGNIYKLIKKYPGLPDDWELGMMVARSDPGKNLGDISEYGAEIAHLFYYPVDAKYSNPNLLLSADMVENNPEFWKNNKIKSMKKKSAKELNIVENKKNVDIKQQLQSLKKWTLIDNDGLFFLNIVWEEDKYGEWIKREDVELLINKF